MKIRLVSKPGGGIGAASAAPPRRRRWTRGTIRGARATIAPRPTASRTRDAQARAGHAGVRRPRLERPWSPAPSPRSWSRLPSRARCSTPPRSCRPRTSTACSPSRSRRRSRRGTSRLWRRRWISGRSARTSGSASTRAGTRSCGTWSSSSPTPWRTTPRAPQCTRSPRRRWSSRARRREGALRGAQPRARARSPKLARVASMASFGGDERAALASVDDPVVSSRGFVGAPSSTGFEEEDDDDDEVGGGNDDDDKKKKKGGLRFKRHTFNELRSRTVMPSLAAWRRANALVEMRGGGIFPNGKPIPETPQAMVRPSATFFRNAPPPESYAGSLASWGASRAAARASRRTAAARAAPSLIPPPPPRATSPPPRDPSPARAEEDEPSALGAAENDDGSESDDDVPPSPSPPRCGETRRGSRFRRFPPPRTRVSRWRSRRRPPRRASARARP